MHERGQMLGASFPEEEKKLRVRDQEMERERKKRLLLPFILFFPRSAFLYFPVERKHTHTHTRERSHN